LVLRAIDGSLPPDELEAELRAETLSAQAILYGLALPGASIATHLAHAIERTSSIAELAGMPPGRIAQPSEPGEAWNICVLEDWDD
jgi:hypothetical protein